jgi:hypothetical protein
LLKVLRVVGEVADKVSSRRLVAFLPNAAGRVAVFRESFGRFDGDGTPASIGTWLYGKGAEGKTATDMVLVVVDEDECRLESGAGDCI